MLLKHCKLTTVLALYITPSQQPAHQTPLLLHMKTEWRKSEMVSHPLLCQRQVPALSVVNCKARQSAMLWKENKYHSSRQAGGMRQIFLIDARGT